MGLNHQTAPLSIRERLSFDSKALSNAVDVLVGPMGCEEALLLSTCNRTEIYFIARDSRSVFVYLSRTAEISENEFIGYTYTYSGSDVFRHATKVACGLDSMVLGETQILGQLKDAFRKAQSAKTLGYNLHKLFQSVFSSAKDVRANTALGQYSVSLASASIRICRRIVENLNTCSILFIGAGEMISLCVKHYSEFGGARISITNRTVENARKLAFEIGADYFDLELLPDRLQHFDIVVSCTGSPLPILGKGAVQNAIAKRRHKPLVIFDLAVPRDVEESVLTIDDVFLYSIDDLGEVVSAGIKNREVASKEAAVIIEAQTEIFTRWLDSVESMSGIKKFRNFGGALVERERLLALDRIRKGSDVEDVINELSRSIKNKFLDKPSRGINKARGDKRDQLIEALIELFELNDLK